LADVDFVCRRAVGRRTGAFGAESGQACADLVRGEGRRGREWRRPRGGPRDVL